jgi:hypothetical protein
MMRKQKPVGPKNVEIPTFYKDMNRIIMTLAACVVVSAGCFLFLMARWAFNLFTGGGLLW